MTKKVIWLYPKLEKWMGGTRYVFECCKLLNRNYDLIVICQKSENLVVDEFRETGINIVELKSRSYTDLKFWFTFKSSIKQDYRCIKKYLSEGDIIISSMFPMNVLAAKFINKHIQIIYEPFALFNDNIYLKSNGFFYFLFFRTISLFYSKYDIAATQKAYKVLTLSKFEQKRIMKTYNVKSDVVYEGINTDFFYPRDTSIFVGKYHGTVPLLHSTGFDSFKGTDLLINSLPELKKRLPNFKLFVTYTRENTDKLKKYNDFIIANKLQENVEFLSFFPYDQLPELYSFCKFYIEVGINRSMSLSNKEALACGTPVIRGDDSDEEVQDGFNGFLVNAFNIDELINAIAIVKESPDKYAYIKANTIKSISQKFTWNSVTDKIVAAMK